MAKNNESRLAEILKKYEKAILSDSNRLAMKRTGFLVSRQQA